MIFKTSISKDEINQLPLYNFDGKYELIDDINKALAATAKLKKYSTLGFDTETRASFRKGEYYDVSLLQLGTDSEVFLFRLNKIPLIPELIEILENPNIIKAGVAIHDDLKALKRLHPFTEQGFVDLATLAKTKGIKNFGLRALAAIFVSKRLSKKEQTSNWEKEVLTESQLTYAACDAAVGHEIYVKLIDC